MSGWSRAAQDHPVGDLGVDTAVTATGDGTYEAMVQPDWEIWGPMGGYVAAIALRAAGAESEGRRPAALSCHYLGVAAFEPVQLRVETRKAGRTATSQRVELSQHGVPVLDALVWSTSATDGLEHDETVAPEVPGPDDLPSLRELAPDAALSFPFWRNIESKPLDFVDPWPPDGPHPARSQQWMRFKPTARFDDPWIDAARSVILVDLPSWPAAHRPHAWKEPPYIAPTLDLNVAFHQPSSTQEWLLCDGTAPLSTGGLFGWTARVWSPGGALHASGGGQCLYRKLRPPT